MRIPAKNFAGATNWDSWPSKGAGPPCRSPRVDGRDHDVDRRCERRGQRAFPLIARLPRLNGAEESERPFEVVWLSRNDPDTDSACSSRSDRCPKPHEEARAVPALTRGENRPVV